MYFLTIESEQNTYSGPKFDMKVMLTMLSTPSSRHRLVPSVYMTSTSSIEEILSSAFLSSVVELSTGMLVEGIPSKYNTNFPPEDWSAVHLSN